MAEQNNQITSFEQVYGHFRVFILDVDGTLMNGNEAIAKVAESVFRLLTDETKKVLFYSNGGYCSLEHTW